MPIYVPIRFQQHLMSLNKRKNGPTSPIASLFWICYYPIQTECSSFPVYHSNLLKNFVLKGGENPYFEYIIQIYRKFERSMMSRIDHFRFSKYAYFEAVIVRMFSQVSFNTEVECAILLFLWILYSKYHALRLLDSLQKRH